MKQSYEKSTKKELIELAEAQQKKLDERATETLRLIEVNVGVVDRLNEFGRTQKDDAEINKQLHDCIDSIREAINTGVMVMFAENILNGTHHSGILPFESIDSEEFHSPAARLLRHLITIIEKRGY